ncbi:MAG: hypothetical protein ED559_12345 [Phycisphaera sp.]|nr:MAG: hypothetical protein ED559_12345 [Phycisphaera sp.]
MTKDNTTKPRHPIRRRFVCKEMGKRRIFWLRVSVVIPLLLVIGLVFIAKSGYAGRLILPSIEQQLGVEIEAGSVSINNSGLVVFENVSVRAPGIEGPGAELARVRRIVADVDWSRAFGGGFALSAITLHSPDVRFSEDDDTGMVNFAAFRLPETGGGIDGPVSLPSVRIIGGSIQLAEHNERRIRVLKRLNIDGELRPDGEDAYKIDLDQIGAQSGLKLAGTIDRLGIEVSLTGVTLEEWGPTSVPGRLRPFVEMLDVEGEISNTIFSMSSSGVVTASVHLNRVGITLPINMNEESGAGRMRMREVSGAISLRDDEFSAEISGLLEDVPYEVNLIYEGLSGDAPFHGNFKIRGYEMARNPDIVPFLPDEVGFRLKQFAGSSLMTDEDGKRISPTAIVDASVTLTRGPPGPDGSAELEYRGNLAFTNGTAAYEVFPYPFQNMTGSVQFDKQRIRIEEIRGVSRTGAIISATGLIEPIGPTASVNLQIDTVNVPIDDVLEEALGENRGGIVDELFDDRRYRQIVERGLVLTRAQAEALTKKRDDLIVEIARAEQQGASEQTIEVFRNRLNETRRHLRTPVFEYRGRADLGIRLRRDEGLVSNWTRRIEVRLPEAGLVLSDFPLPIHARDVVVVMSETEATLMRGSFRPVTGGVVTLSGGADLRTPEGETAFRPAIRVIADKLPVSDLLRFAVAPPFAQGDDENVVQARQAGLDVLKRLGVGGNFDVDGLLLTRPSGDLGFDLELDLANVTVTPEALPDRPPVILTDLEGKLRLTEQGMSLNAASNALGVSGDASLEDPIEVRASADLDWSDNKPLRYDAHVEADGVLFDLPFEQAVASVSDRAGESLVWLRDTFHPVGKADIRADLTSDGYNPVSDITIKNIQWGEADYLRGRLGLTDSTGSARILIDDYRAITTDGISGTLTFDGEPMGNAHISGTLGLDEEGGDPNRMLEIALSDGRFDSSLAERVVRDIVGGAIAKEYLEHGLRGGFDAVVRMTEPRPPVGAAENVGVARFAFVETTIEPKWGEMTRLGTTVRFDEMSGKVVASKLGARLEGVSAKSNLIDASISGAATPDGSGGTISSVSLDFEAEMLSPQVRALLPIPLIEIIDAGEMSSAGSIRTKGARLRTQTAVGVEGVKVDFEGTLGFEEAALTAGARIDEAVGTAHVSFSKNHTGLPTYKVDVEVASARAMGLPIQNARASIESTGKPRGLVAPVIFAESCGGVISGRAGVYPAMDWAGPGERAYETSLIFSGLKLNEALDGFASARPDAPTRDPRPDTGARLEGLLALGGLVGKEETRRGSLSLQIAGGDVIAVPGAMMLVEAGNLQFPASEGIDYASVEAVFDGNLVSVEGISLISKSVELLGYGTATWPELELDLRMRSRATRRIPVVSQLLETIRDEFVTIAVSGTAAVPDIRVESLPETRRVIGRVLGFEQSASDRRLTDLSERASKQRRLRNNR